MREIMISIKPEWVEKILNHTKTIEIRKTMPKCELPIKCYIYQTKNNWIYKILKWLKLHKGKVVAEFTLKQVDKLEFRHLSVSHTNAYIPVNEDADYQWEKHCCVDYEDIVEYGKFAPLYACHITDLEIYDEPKELSEFKHWVKDVEGWNNKKHKKENLYVLEPLKRPPQSWCYVEDLEEV